jgi:hypothetical protein
MARSLPLYYYMDQESHEFADTDETTKATMKFGTGTAVPGGVLLRGVVGNMSGTGQKVTVRAYAAATGDLRYEVELDFSSATDASDILDTGIPIFGTPYWTVQVNGGTQTGKFRFYVQAISAIT